MTSVVLRIFFQGLIAFVPGYPDRSHITALVVDATGAEVPKKFCVAEHYPRLRFDSTKSAGCPNGCYLSGTGAYCDCVFSLQQQLIVIKATAQPAPTEPGRAPGAELPASTQAAADFAYLQNMSNLGHSVLKSALSGTADHLIGRMVFPFTRLTACQLGTPSGRLHSFNFHPPGSHQRGWKQAVAESLIVEAEIPDGNVTLSLSRPGNSSASTDFSLAPYKCEGGRYCVDVWLTNEVYDPCNLGCDNGVGRDFAFYYGLTAVPPPWDLRPVPDAELDLEAGSPNLPEVSLCDYTAEECTESPTSHPVCAMTTFYP